MECASEFLRLVLTSVVSSHLWFQIAIAKFFDGEAPDPVEQAQAALAASPSPSSSIHRETLLESFQRPSNLPHRDPAPRIVPQPENRDVYKPPFILSLLFTPFNVAYRLFYGSLSLFGYLFPFLPRFISSFTRSRPSRSARRNTTGRRPLKPRDTAARFIREFEEEYGSHSLKFFEDGYAQAYDLAKKDLKILLVILLSPEHDDTSTFVRETLLSADVQGFIENPQNNLILWAGNVQDSEAYQVSNHLNCTKFPFAALIAHTPQDSPTSMSTVCRIAGLLPPTALIAKLQTSIAEQSAQLNRVRAARAEQQASRSLRQEQESAYERSLAQDRERARQRREAGAARVRAEQEAKAQAEASEKMAQKLDQWRRWKSQEIAPEPGPEVKNATRLSIRMPTGDRIVRKFGPNATMEELYAFVECHDLLEHRASSSQVSKPDGYEHSYGFKLVSPMPRVVYGVDDGGNIGAKIGRSGNLIVESIETEEDED